MAHYRYFRGLQDPELDLLVEESISMRKTSFYVPAGTFGFKTDIRNKLVKPKITRVIELLRKRFEKSDDIYIPFHHESSFSSIVESHVTLLHYSRSTRVLQYFDNQFYSKKKNDCHPGFVRIRKSLTSILKTVYGLDIKALKPMKCKSRLT
jgi:hypothetical protein